MPDSRTERIAFAVGLTAIAALALALIPAYQHYRHSSVSSAPAVDLGTSTPAQQTVYRPASRPSGAAAAAKPKRTKPVVRTRPQTAKKIVPTVKPATPKRTKLALASTRGDCWVEARQGSSKGKVLYVGTLVKGKSLNLSVSRLWVRFGAPQNVDLSINGDAASIPGGAQDFVVTRNGVKAAPA